MLLNDIERVTPEVLVGELLSLKANPTPQNITLAKVLLGVLQDRKENLLDKKIKLQEKISNPNLSKSIHKSYVDEYLEVNMQLKTIEIYVNPNQNRNG
ncbi:MAG: hypothetical protein MUC49_15705 [Raineya sp.]|jgi:hypothetical protein|nr:hypothetical protein [Raineya sp.]